MSSGPRQGGRRPGGKRAGGGPPGKWRLFLGAFLPPELREPLEFAQSRLVGKYWKPTEPESLHVTLLYLGGTARSEVGRIEAAARETASLVPAFDAVLRGTGFFPNEGGPRVWFARAEGEGFMPLAAGLRSRVLPGTDEDFKPHVTLARKKGPSPRPGPVVFDLPWTVDHFTLVRSSLSPAGPTYEPLAHFTLPTRPPNAAADAPEAA